MAKDKNTDYSKLSLGVKIPVKPAQTNRTQPKAETAKLTQPKTEKVIKPEKAPKPIKETAPKTAKVDEAVKAIHANPAPKIIKPTKTEERTLRVTLDIPLSLHAQIRTRTFQDGISMKEYFLDLARKELGIS